LEPNQQLGRKAINQPVSLFSKLTVYYRARDDEVIILHVRRAEKLLDLDDLI
jgi:hypothetical protein